MSCPIYPMSDKAGPAARLDLAVDMARSGYGWEDIRYVTKLESAWRIVQLCSQPVRLPQADAYLRRLA